MRKIQLNVLKYINNIGDKVMRRGIEPVIAEIILIAVAIAIAIAFASWIFGFWNVHSSSHGEGLQFYPDSYVSTTGNEIYLHLKAHLNPTISFYIDIPGYDINDISVVKVISGDVSVNSNNKIVAKIGSEFWLKIDLNSPVSGSEIKVKIYSDQGYVYWYTIHR